jgi:diadenosine tetraphosphate (Ap4A) HIT family hydrolase
LEQDINCPFCSAAESEKVLRSALCYARWDKYPVTEGQLLIMPNRHSADYFSATPDERIALWATVDEAKKLFGRQLQGGRLQRGRQTVMRCHIHLIPRRSGDSINPRGGRAERFPGQS